MYTQERSGKCSVEEKKKKQDWSGNVPRWAMSPRDRVRLSLVDKSMPNDREVRKKNEKKDTWLLKGICPCQILV